MNFDQKYYQEIWGTVHRHDYCESLADELIQKYGRVKFLDIGTGCGCLVKTLRAKGAKAWGMDISDYAVANTCAPGYVVHGDVRNIPFSNNFFDVVFSQGLWEYVPKKDIQKAWAECTRVGKLQEHKIDTTQCEYHDHFETYESQAWWNRQLKPVSPKVLVACPNHESKEYAFGEWIESVKKINYPNKAVLVVDNSPTLDFFNRWKDKVPMVHLDLPEGPNRRIALSMEYIRNYVLANGFDFYLSLESDIIPPANVLDYFLRLGEYDWYEHHYPYRGKDWKPLLNGFGCTMFSRRLLGENHFDGCPENMTPDGYFWNHVVVPNPNYTSYKIIESYNDLEIKHLEKEVK